MCRYILRPAPSPFLIAIGYLPPKISSYPLGYRSFLMHALQSMYISLYLSLLYPRFAKYIRYAAGFLPDILRLPSARPCQQSPALPQSQRKGSAFDSRISAHPHAALIATHTCLSLMAMSIL